MKKYLILIIAASLAAASCNKTESPVSPSEDKLPIELSLSLQTKATDASFENGDKIGVYVTYNGYLDAYENYVDNAGFSLSGNKWVADNEIYWADKTNTADFYCYYPYGTPVDATAYNFTVKSDQTSRANYAASDFLWGRTIGAAPGTGAVSIRTSHIMSNILVYLEPGDGFTSQEFAAAQKSVTIGNVKNNSIVNLASGGVSATGDVSVLTPYWTGECHRAIVVPQNVAADASLIILNINDVTYTLAREFSFEARTQHKLTVTVNKSTSGLNVSIDSWLIDETEHTGSAM